MLRRFFQLNDWEMLEAGHVKDVQAEALTASPSNTGIEASEKSFQGIGVGLYDKCSRRKGQGDMPFPTKLAGPLQHRHL